MSGPVPYWSDGQITLHLGDCLDILPSLPEASIDSIVTDPPYGLEFMGKEWDGADGFRRSLNPADAGRDSVFGRTSRTGPEYRASVPAKARLRTREDGRTNPRSGRSRVTVPESYTTGAGQRGQPGIGARPTDWVSNQGWNGFRCRNCGHLAHGGSPCTCEKPDFARADGRWNLFQEWCEAWATQCLRVLKPGGFMLCFGGARTWHRLACGIEDAGFEIRDSLADLTGIDGPGLAWVYGEGFPKNQDAARAVDMHVCTLPGRHCMRRLPQEPRPDDHVCPESPEGDPWRGWGTAWKPAWEPIVCARKPLAGTLAVNLLDHGTGALNTDAGRVAHTSDADRAESEGKNRHADFGSGPRQHQGVYAGMPAADRAQYDGSAGRWPPNLILGESAAAEVDRQSGVTVSRAGSPRSSATPGDGWGMTHTGAEYADAGGASRFFPCFRYSAKADSGERPRLEDGTTWPTVKPVDPIRWLVRLVTPPGGTVGDFFAGTGTTGEACIIEGFNCILADKDPIAMALMRERLRKDIQPDLFGSGGAA